MKPSTCSTSTRTDFVPMGSLAADIESVIEHHLNVSVDCACGEGGSTVDGVDAAALAIVKLLQERGIEA